MMIVLLIVFLTVAECDIRTVVGQTGQDVSLPCSYDIKQLGAVEVCWGRGELPSWGGCSSNQLISTDRHKVTSRTSSRFQLLGRLDEGNVSLTILNLTEEDAGTYGCRVMIPGWRNDGKHHLNLVVVEAPDPTSSAPSGPQTTTANQTAGPVTTAELQTSSPAGPGTSQDGSMQTVVLVGVLVLLLVLLAAGGLFIIARRRQQLKPADGGNSDTRSHLYRAGLWTDLSADDVIRQELTPGQPDGKMNFRLRDSNTPCRQTVYAYVSPQEPSGPRTTSPAPHSWVPPERQRGAKMALKIRH